MSEFGIFLVKLRNSLTEEHLELFGLCGLYARDCTFSRIISAMVNTMMITENNVDQLAAVLRIAAPNSEASKLTEKYRSRLTDTKLIIIENGSDGRRIASRLMLIWAAVEHKNKILAACPQFRSAATALYFIEAAKIEDELAKLLNMKLGELYSGFYGMCYNQSIGPLF